MPNHTEEKKTQAYLEAYQTLHTQGMIPTLYILEKYCEGKVQDNAGTDDEDRWQEIGYDLSKVIAKVKKIEQS